MTVCVTQIERYCLRQVDSVLVENPEMLRIVRELAPETRCVISPPGIDIHAFHPSANGWTPTGPIVAVGRLNEPRKGYDRMLQAYVALCSQFSPPPLHIVGRGSPRDLHAQITQLGLQSQVHVHANMNEEHYRALLPTCSVFWQASHEEGLGIAALEAMAAGLPVVATSTAGTRATVQDGTTGYLVDQGRNFVAEMVQRTIEVISSTGDHMATAARDHVVEYFSTDVTLRAFLREIEVAEAEYQRRSLNHHP